MGSLADLLATGLGVDPDAVAVYDDSHSWSFAELEGRACAVASAMAVLWGVQAGDRVIVDASRRRECVLVALAAWKLGAIYVPLDNRNGSERLARIAESIQPALAVIAPGTIHAVPAVAIEILLAMSNQWQEAAAPATTVAGTDIAVIIHTSGSTGEPKGVMLSHDSILCYFQNHNRFLGFDSDSRGMNNGPFHFDVSIQDTFLPLFFGASVLFHEQLFLPSYIIGLIDRYRITHLVAVSSVLELISRSDSQLRRLAGGSLRRLVTGGEVCPPRQISRWLEVVDGLSVLYGYGPTECNSLCTTYVITKAEPGRTSPYPIGRPFAGMTAILLDEHDRLIRRAGEIGTLALAGPQLMLGYWRDPDLTGRVLRLIGKRLFYVTGDLCYRQSDGDLVFVGRSDSEVKVRGRRINLREITDAFAAQPAVAFAHAQLIDVAGDSHLACFVHLAAKIGEAALVGGAAQLLADYMVPRYIVTAKEVPRTSTGKICVGQIENIVAAAVRAAPDERWIDGCGMPTLGLVEKAA